MPRFYEGSEEVVVAEREVPRRRTRIEPPVGVQDLAHEADLPVRRQEAGAEALDLHVAVPMRLPRLRDEAAARARPLGEVPNHAPRPQRPRPDAPAREVDPAEPPDEDAVRREVRERDRDRRAVRSGLPLV